MAVKIYHHARCAKSREACAIIANRGIDATIIDYIKVPPSEQELKELLKLLGIKAVQLVRKSEPLYKLKYKNKTLSETQWISVLAKNPLLIERPIIVNGNKAVIGRPPEKVNELFS